jgi:glycosyltransferase involved in cell wall biosynthesis
MKLSIILPAYREPYLNRTIDSLLENAVGEIEILPVIDGYGLEEQIIVDERVKPIILEKNLGMRGSINAGLVKAQGEFIMKLDAHCAVAKGFDITLINDCKENWLMVPRRYALNEDTWEKNSPAVDYHYLIFPEVADDSYGYSMQVTSWEKRKDEIGIDDIMTFQGSCWFANRKYFMEHVGLLDDRLETYGTFAQDQQEIGLKYWLGGGEVKVDKNTWYAHLFKQKRHYSSGDFSRKHKKDKYHISGNEWGTKHWVNNEEPGMTKTFEWYINKFSPPTWPEDWKQIFINKGLINK